MRKIIAIKKELEKVHSRRVFMQFPPSGCIILEVDTYEHEHVYEACLYSKSGKVSYIEGSIEKLIFPDKETFLDYLKSKPALPS